ncbi:aminotransferase class I/II-fold pyridoxal phosphate-dependent enzyme [Motilibacter sp. E257]|uniref:Aminotransferase class I/II-fold pyridoxal phosphate-dependent enzyme n=1 Tax=Motilibacter deserti TaxID=2714956 RepID=A0ABX0GQG1_9ACTN|nr:aminotransferase class I/II-fold pyridoxal phosphate-dependent enzyme [Motilibacter deserti]
MVDLRSDTVTKPTRGMREAIAAAEVGDDVYGEDPTVRELEERVAGLLGHEAALFTGTGSLANLLGVALLVRPGQELLCDAQAHVVRAELGAHASVHGVTTRTWHAERGLLDADEVLAMVAPDAGPFIVRTAAIAVENSHNFGGGTVQPIEQLQRLRSGALERGVSVHLDGARLWNAHVASGTSLQEYGACADTVMVALSKGLGAPVGSLLVSSADRIAAARDQRKRLGGGMRQVGILAAAGLYALDTHLERLADDHAHARRLADVLGVDPATVDTNIVIGDVADAPAVAAAAAEEGVLVSALGPRILRAVTHLDVDEAGIERAVDVLGRALKG